MSSNAGGATHDGAPAASELLPAGVGPDGMRFVGTEPGLPGPVVVYRLHPLPDDEQRQRMRRFDVLAAWRVEHALPVRRVDLKGGVVVVGQRGRPLEEVLARGQPEAAALRWMEDVARALADLHRGGLVHGALDPSAVYIDDDGRGHLDVTGFRASVSEDPLPAACRRPVMEMRERRGAAADVWALGVLLLACFEGTEAAAAHAGSDEDARKTVSGMSQGRAPAVLAREMMDLEPSWRPSAEQVARRLASIRGVNEPTSDPSVADPPVSVSAPSFDVDEVATSTEGGRLEQIGRFRLEQLVGQGAMGRVYRARDVATDDVVALKLVGADAVPSARARRRFKKEARLLSEVRNPGVAALIDAGEDAHGQLWMAVEYVEGTTLSKVLAARGPLPEPDALALIADVCRALIDVHDAGIVHRDLKPDNILVVPGPVSNRPRVKLIDFGIARHVDESESLAFTRQGAVMGTPLYMSPEQASGQPVDVRTDVYALGNVLYELLAGKAPFAGNGAAMVLSMQVDRVPPRITEVRPEISDEVARLIARCLEKDRAARFADGRELLGALQRLLREEETRIGAHPRAPATDGVQRWVFEWELKGSPRALWPYVANTDRVNRAIGVPAVDEAVAVVDGDPQRTGHARQAGFDLKWREHPYEWVHERRIGVLREYSDGPLRFMRSAVDFEALPAEKGGGTRLVQTIEIEPRGVLGRAAAAVEIGVKMRRALDRVYRRIDELLQARQKDPSDVVVTDAWEAQASLSLDTDQRLEQLEKKVVERGADAGVMARLGDWLRAAAAPDLSRMRPLALARRLGVDEDRLVRACLIGAREGLLVPLWDLLCPSCRAPAGLEETLRELSTHAHCDACNVDFALDLSTSIELVFRAHPQVRAVDDGVWCLSSPGKTPHVMAQVRIAPGERFVLDMALPEGSWQLVGRRLPYAATFRTRTEATGSRLELSLSEGPHAAASSGTGRVLSASRQELVLVNDTGREQLVRVEQTAARDDVFTAARAAAHPLFRTLYPHEVLKPGALVRVSDTVLVHAEVRGPIADRAAAGDADAFAALWQAYKALETVVVDEGGTLVKLVGDGVLAVFDVPLAAVRAAKRFAGVIDEAAPGARVRAGVHRGATAAVTMNERLDYFGAAVQEVVELARAASDGHVLASDAVIADPAVARLLDREARAGALLSQEATFDVSTDPVLVIA